jgi:hypothetical protein
MGKHTTAFSAKVKTYSSDLDVLVTAVEKSQNEWIALQNIDPANFKAVGSYKAGAEGWRTKSDYHWQYAKTNLEKLKTSTEELRKERATFDAYITKKKTAVSINPFKGKKSLTEADAALKASKELLEKIDAALKKMPGM